MRPLLSAIFFLLVATTSEPAHADQVRFTGRTTADPVLIKDALQQILGFAYATENCQVLSVVEATVLPADYVPENPQYRVADVKVNYERWDAHLCGRVTPFLIGFWASPEGGTMFQVSHPLPDDVPSAHGR